jgi:hypothetical protein
LLLGELKVEPQAAQNLPTPEDLAFVETFRKEIEQGTADHRKARRQFWAKLVLRRLLGVTGAVIVINVSLYLFGGLTALIIAFILTCAGAGVSIGEMADSAHSNVLKKVEGATDSRLVGVLIEMTSTGDFGLRQSALKALTNILPQIRASDAPYIPDTSMSTLIGLVNKPPDVHLILAVLKALGQVGDERAIQVVKLLSEYPMTASEFYLTERNANIVREVAKECLPTLISRSEQAKLRKTLLRAADVSDKETGALLRPAAASQENPERLLRVVDLPDSQEVLQQTTQD